MIAAVGKSKNLGKVRTEREAWFKPQTFHMEHSSACTPTLDFRLPDTVFFY